MSEGIRIIDEKADVNGVRAAIDEGTIIRNHSAEKEAEKTKDVRKPYSLSPETLVKLGFTDEKEKKEPDTDKPEDKQENKKIESEDDKLEKDATITEDDKNKDKSKESDKEVNPDKGTGDDKYDDLDEEKPKFIDKVQSLIENHLKEIDDPDDQEDFLKDLEKGLGDRMKFVTSLTQKAMELGDKRKNADSLLEKLSSDKVKSALEKVNELGDLDDFLHSADKWYDDENDDEDKNYQPDKSKNPIRALIESLQESSPKALKHVEEEKALSKRESDIALREEILDLYEIDSVYKDLPTLHKLADLADEHNVNLKTAHLIRQGTALDESLKESTEKIRSLETDIRKLKKELKDRNSQLEKKIISDPITKSTEGVMGGGISGDAFLEPSTGFDETTRRIKKKLGLYS